MTRAPQTSPARVVRLSASLRALLVEKQGVDLIRGREVFHLNDPEWRTLLRAGQAEPKEEREI